MKVKRKLQLFFFAALSKISRSKSDAILWANSQNELSPHTLIAAFAQGVVVFPTMRNHKIIEWLDPEIRGVLPINQFKMQDGLYKLLKKERDREVKEFDIKIDANFEETIRACSKPRDAKAITWLSEAYIDSTIALHQLGFAHSVEAYQGDLLVGGVVGIAINGYFMSLSLFHAVNNASKVAFYYLMLKLKADGFQLHDLGMPNPWIQQFGMKSISRQEFRANLLKAMATPCVFTRDIPALTFPFSEKNMPESSFI